LLVRQNFGQPLFRIRMVAGDVEAGKHLASAACSVSGWSLVSRRQKLSFFWPVAMSISPL
jgi:hypothetical protein